MPPGSAPGRSACPEARGVGGPPTGGRHRSHGRHAPGPGRRRRDAQTREWRRTSFGGRRRPRKAPGRRSRAPPRPGPAASGVRSRIAGRRCRRSGRPAPGGSRASPRRGPRRASVPGRTVVLLPRGARVDAEGRFARMDEAPGVKTMDVPADGARPPARRCDGHARRPDRPDPGRRAVNDHRAVPRGRSGLGRRRDRARGGRVPRASRAGPAARRANAAAAPPGPHRRGLAPPRRGARRRRPPRRAPGGVPRPRNASDAPRAGRFGRGGCRPGAVGGRPCRPSPSSRRRCSWSRAS